MPETRGYVPGSTDSYGRRRFDPRSLAAARRVAVEIGMPTNFDCLPSVYLRVVEVDPLLQDLDPTMRRLSFLKSLSNNGDSEIAEAVIPLAVRYAIEEIAAERIHAWKELRKDPIKYLMAALIDIYG